MATTGISALGNDQIIAIAALSSKNAATAEYTTGGDGLQGLYDTMKGNSATWSTVTDKLNTTAFSTVSGSFITSLPQDLATTGDIADLAESVSETYQVKGDYLTTGDSAEFYTTGNPSGFITGVDLSPYQEKTAMTAYQPVGDYMTADALTGVSSTWNTVTDKLDSTAFSTVSGNFLTSHQSLPESATWDTVTSKLDTTAFSTVSGSFLTAHQELSESANWNSTYNTVSDNSASWATVTDKLDSTAFSYVSGGFLTTAEAANFYTTANESGFITAHQSLPESANWNETYTEVSTNSANWNSAAAMNELPVSAGEGMDIQNVDGNIVFSCTGGSVPEGVLVESGLEYNADNEISGYNGSAIAQSLRTDETVLWSGARTSAIETSESMKNFEKCQIYIAHSTYGPPQVYTIDFADMGTTGYFAITRPRGASNLNMACIRLTADDTHLAAVNAKCLAFGSWSTTATGVTATTGEAEDLNSIIKVVGVNRIGG